MKMYRQILYRKKYLQSTHLIKNLYMKNSHHSKDKQPVSRRCSFYSALRRRVAPGIVRANISYDAQR